MVFPFVEKPKKRNLNLIKAHSIYDFKINALIKVEQTHLMHLKQDVNLQSIQNQLQTDLMKSKISNFQRQIKNEVFCDLPNAFWDRKQHIIDLPYENDFDEKQIPTKARPIQINFFPRKTLGIQAISKTKMLSFLANFIVRNLVIFKYIKILF